MFKYNGQPVSAIFFRLYILSVFFSNTLFYYFPNPLFKVLSDGLFFVVLADIIVSKELRGKKFNTVVLIIFACFICYSVWSFAVGNGLSVLLLSLRQNKNFLLLFYIAIYKGRDEAFVFKTLSFLLYLSVPLAIIQRATSTSTTGDDVIGFLGRGASGYLTILILFYFFSELYSRLKDNKKKVGYYWLTLIPTFINETKIVYILFPVLYLLILALAKKLQVKQVVLSGIVVFCFILGSNFVYSFVYAHRNDNAASLFTKEGFVSYMTTDDMIETESTDLKRLTRIIAIHDFLKMSPPYHYLFGYGVGGTFVGTSSGANGLVSRKIHDQRVNEGSRIQLYVFLGEFGVLGTVVLAAFLLVLLIFLLKYNTFEHRGKAAIILVLMIFSATYNMFGLSEIGSFLFYYYLLLAFKTNRKAIITQKPSVA